MRLIQHKKEAYWFYRFLSIFYDQYVNPLFWTRQMRDQALELAELNAPDLKVIDVGAGTGFTTEGIAKYVESQHITCIDQSPHQMEKARKKPDLEYCSFVLGDAEHIPCDSDTFDRYVSAGSIEYWPNPQQGINEAYRVLKPGGVALLIGPLEPENRFARFIANTWMLFPTDREYRDWFEKAGFENIRVRYIRPQWYRRDAEFGIAIAGVKPRAGVSPLVPGNAYKVTEEEEPLTFGRVLQIFFRVILGSIAGFLFIPIALFGYLRNSLRSQKDIPEEYREKLTTHQIVALLVMTGIIVAVILWIFS